VPIEIASTFQTASINRYPDPRHDINPSTAASTREPVIISSSDDMSDVGEDEIPVSVLRPIPRRHNLPPLPDLRFEQSYLRSIEKADSWVKVAWITFRDQVIRLSLMRLCSLCANQVLCLGHLSACHWHNLGTRIIGMEILEPQHTGFGDFLGLSSTDMASR
jgi:hypothetical protein